jgi:predicted dehydrogenase
MIAPTRIAVIGLGMGGHHAQVYQSSDRADLVALCDKDPAWLAHVGHTYPAARAYADYHDLLRDEQVEAVSVCVPTSLHARVSIEALEAGKHVLCEKPMACNAEEARAMTAAARSAGRVLMVAQNQRFTAAAQYLRHIVDEGRLGKLYFVRAAWRRPMGMFPSPTTERATGVINRNWFNESAAGGGVLRDLGSHLLDLSLWMLGFPAVTDVLSANYSAFVAGLAAQQGARADAEDLAAGMVRFASGAALQFDVSFGAYVEQDETSLDLYGTRGGASLRNQETLKVFTGDHGTYWNSAIRLGAAGSNPQENFVNAIQTGTAPLVTGEQGVAVIELLDALYAAGINPVTE